MDNNYENNRVELIIGLIIVVLGTIIIALVVLNGL